MREQRGAQGEGDLIVLGAIELGGGGETKVKSIKLLNYIIFPASLQNEIKSFYTAIDQPIAEVLPGGFGQNRKISAAGLGERLYHGCVLFYLGDSGDHLVVPIPKKKTTRDNLCFVFCTSYRTYHIREYVPLTYV